MSEAYAREILKRNVAQICQTIGWNGTNSTPLDILVHVLEKYIRTLGTKANEYAEQFSRTEPNLDDLGLVFQELHVQLPELVDYTRSVPPIPPPVSVDKFPKPKESNLNFLKPGSHEVVTRPMHVHEHLPPMYPEKEREAPAVADTIEIKHNGTDTAGPSGTCPSPEICVTDSPEKQKEIFKRPIDPVSLPSKRPRLRLEEEERTREISSVMMTMSGFLSPAREGKLPEARSPTVISEKHRLNSHHPHPSRGPSAHPPLDRSEKKSKKSKLVNGKVMKSKRRDKSHRSESGRSKDSSKLEKHPPGVPSRLPHNHVTMPPPVPLLPEPVIKQEPVEPLVPPDPPVLAMPGEETIPVPRRIPISKSPLIANVNPINKHAAPTAISEPEIKTEKVDTEEKLASQPDRSKINIFKRISNKNKDDKITTEVVPEKSHSDILISRLQFEEGSRIDSINHHTEHTSMKVRQEVIVNNNDVAMDLSKQITLTTNEVINLDDDFDKKPVIVSKNYPEPCPIPMTVNKTFHLPSGKDAPGVSPKLKKEKKHKDKREKSIEKAAKLLKKQQLAMTMAQVANQNLSNFKMTNSKPKSKSSRPKNESKMPYISSAFPSYPNFPPDFSLPGVPQASRDLLAGIHNNSLHLPHNLLGNPFALGVGGPGLIPRPNFLPGAMGPGMLPMSMGNFGHSSRSQVRNIPPMLRRPSLEVIALDNDNMSMNMIHKPPLMNPVRDKDKHDKHKVIPIPNIIQKHKKSQKEHKSNMLKMPPIQPDITIELNPPKVEPVREVPKVKTPSPLPPVSPERIPQPTPEVPLPLQLPIKEEKIEKKKDKSHKKEKKDKDGVKIKKKKDKKDKNKDKSEKKKDKEEKNELKDKIKKEKKEKKKEKLIGDGLVPKLTLRLGTNSPMPIGSPDIFKLNIKPIVKRDNEVEEVVKNEPLSREHSRSPELAQMTALVTRPKVKNVIKLNHVAETLAEPPSPAVSSPPRKNRPPSGNSKYKRILLKPLSKKDDESTPSTDPASSVSPYYVDEQGNKIWVCPACRRRDNGSPMIGCDGCDCWYHWICVGITEEPGSAEDWFCARCHAKREAMALAGLATHSKKRSRKTKTD